ncbi:MAG: glutathione S-transferase family protein [Candidatus Binataceae bacterium]
MKATLYQFVTSPFCSKVRKILDYKGLDYQIVEVDYVERKELIAASGQIMVPVLRLENVPGEGVQGEYAQGEGGGVETIVGSDRIAMRLEELRPEPTILPARSRGLHLALTRYIESEVEEALFCAAVPDAAEYFASQGADRLALFRLIRDRKYGAGFCERMERERDANMSRVREMLEPFEMALEHGAFLLGGAGLADFALYGQLHFLALSGVLKIPTELWRVREFYGRVDRISAKLEETAA